MKLGKKGVSPVIAVLLLIVIAVAAAVLTYLWVLGYIGTVQSTGGTEQLQKRIKIEGVNTVNNTVYVRNIGDIKVTIDAVYVLNATGVIASNTSIEQEIDPGNVQEISLPSVTWESGKTYIVKTVTETGTEATYTFTYRE